MKGDSKGLLAITVSILVFLIWYSFVVPHFWPQEEMAEGQDSAREEGVTTKTEGAGEEAAKTTAEDVVASEEVEETLSMLKTSKFVATFTTYGAAPIKWELEDYNVKKDDKTEPVRLVPEKRLPVMPLGLEFEKASFGFPDQPKYELVEVKKDLLKYRWKSEQVVIEKVYTVGENGYDVNLEVVVKNVGQKTITEKLSLGWTAALPKEEKKGGFFSFLKRPSDQKTPVYVMNGKLEKGKSPAGMKEAEYESGRVYWAGIEDRYFLSAIVPRAGSEELAVKLEKFGKAEDAGFYSGLVLPEMTIAPDGSEKYNFTVYAGPKEMRTLKAMGMNLDKAIDYGWFTFIAIPILYILKFLYSIVHNYGIAIILLTIFIKVILYPISKRSMKSMKGMKDIQPQLKELKEKYKNDKERLNLEMMQLFKRNKVNPMSGCVPMILQFPVYIALYRVFWNSIELYQAPFFWFYTDLSQPDPYYITPVLLGVAMFLQQKLTPSATADPTQQKMMMIMPLMFAVFLAFLPVGLVIYILVNTLMTVLQQWMSNNDIRVRDLLRGKFPKRASA